LPAKRAQAIFDHSAAASNCAFATSPGVEKLGLQVRAGIHTSKCEWSAAMQSESLFTSARGSPRTRVLTRSWSRVRSEIFWSEAKSRLRTAGSAHSGESRVSGGCMLSNNRVDACLPQYRTTRTVKAVHKLILEGVFLRSLVLLGSLRFRSVHRSIWR